MNRSEKWNDLEHQVWALMKSIQLSTQDSWLLAVSGGLDSMVMLEIITRLKPRAHIRVAHYHHGPVPGLADQFEFRNKARECVQHKISSLYSQGDLNIEWITEESQKNLLNEDECRRVRWDFFRRLRRSGEPLLTAHQQNDWTETILLKLIRGSSLDGISRYQLWDHDIFRPLFKIPKADLRAYAQERQVEWVEDPSNHSTDPLRNWIREKWLVDLENKQNGACDNLSRSLFQIIEEHRQRSTFVLELVGGDLEQGISRSWFLSLSDHDQIKALAQYLKLCQIHEFTQGQLLEIQKRLDKNQKDLTFELLGRKWVINASQVMLG